ncbi:PREDICTED: doublecortin domain-containing protein 2B-like, partial [Chlamydotis macqueenii]|uniref:doublecortin domain-containing protein 2B-like n=1 Tax=Chlamydotis macqueenii TaxID=187382 RepID=UPI000529B16D
MSSRGAAWAPPAKNVVVYRNGDPFFPGRRFVVNQRRFLSFEAFLNEVTESIHAPSAVRSLYTPRHGHCVAELRDLQDGCQYVAAGFEKFKRLDYLNQGRRELRGTRTSEGLQFRAPAPGKSNVPARWQKHTHLPCTIHVFRNGDLLSPPFPVLLSKSTALPWDALLATLTEKADLRSGAVSKLCRLDGTKVSGGEELVNGNYYVAVGDEEYQKLPYFELLVPQAPACRTLWNHPNNRRKNHRSRFGELYATSQDGAGDSALAEPPQQLDSRRVQATGAAEKEKIPAAFPPLQRHARKSHRKEEETLFHAKPVHAGQNRRSNRSVQRWPDKVQLGPTEPNGLLLGQEPPCSHGITSGQALCLRFPLRLAHEPATQSVTPRRVSSIPAAAPAEMSSSALGTRTAQRHRTPDARCHVIYSIDPPKTPTGPFRNSKNEPVDAK